MKNVILSLIYVFILFVVAMNVIDKGYWLHRYLTNEKTWLVMAFLTVSFGYWVLYSIETLKK